MSPVRRSLYPLSRVFIAFIFFVAGVGKILDWNGTVQSLALVGVPAPEIALALTTFLEIAGALALFIGFQTRKTAGILAAYLVMVTFVFHRFWGLSGLEAQMQMVNFLKNFAIVGGLVLLSLYGAGPLSVDDRRKPNRAKFEFEKEEGASQDQPVEGVDSEVPAAKKRKPAA